MDASGSGNGVVTSSGGCIKVLGREAHGNSNSKVFELSGGVDCSVQFNYVENTSSGGEGFEIDSNTTVHAIIGHLNCSGQTTYNVNSGSWLYILVGEVQGTDAAAGGRVLQTKAGYIGDARNDINSLTSKGTPVSADVLIIEDSADSFIKKKATIGSLPSSGGGGWTQANTIFVGKHGNDSNAGSDPSAPKITISAAISVLSGASSTSPAVIKVMDGGIYSENLVLTSTYDWIFIDAPAAELNGYIRMEGNNQHVVLKRHECTSGYNYGAGTTALYLGGSYSSGRTYRCMEGSFTSAITNVVYEYMSLTGGTSPALVHFDKLTVTGTSNTCFYDARYGLVVYEIGYLNTQRSIYDSLNALYYSILKIDHIKVDSSSSYGMWLFDTAHDLHFEVGYVMLSGRAKLFNTGINKAITGSFGFLDGYTDTFPIDLSNSYLWGLDNVRTIEVNHGRFDGTGTGTLGNGKYAPSVAFNQYVYYDFTLPEPITHDSMWLLFPNFVTSSSDSSSYLSWKADWAVHSAAYNTNNGSNAAYSLGALTGNDLINRIDVSGMFSGTKPLGGDHVMLGLALGSGTGSVYYFGHLDIVYWKNSEN